MKITVITPTYNVFRTIKKTMESVAAQVHPVAEYIVVDSYSSDGTRGLVASFSEQLPLTILSEPALGVFHAMNSGIRVAHGDIIGILNGDDYYYSPKVLSRVIEEFRAHPEAAIVYGDIAYEDSKRLGRVVRHWRTGEYTPQKFYSGWAMPHPAVFVRREAYANAGLFNERFRIAGDYEIMLRWLYVHDLGARYVPSVFTVMGTGGLSSRSLLQRFRGWKELRRAWVVNGFSVPPFFITRRVLGKLSQFSKKAIRRDNI